ncbi:hypothetical protein LJY18_11390 [Pseudomonas sp. MMS21-TM103]|uniref:hypothetical protein n=1 Tax=Pseudomonas sp. MMS21 TM103 TaxID=2886506 RepID=UPI001EDDCA61|nr:hypothetical protein [Pseudomonas sp. MMS21 TM103]MCG4453898.1 hypothetical protein [Pseudomonas sp. MMS21 TM103]
MMIARWSIDAKFGYKQNVIDLMQRWMREIAPQVGLDTDKMRLLTGSVGALEATVQAEHLIDDLTELNQVWEKLATIAAHKQWSKDLEPHVVSGTSRWEIYRVL